MKKQVYANTVEYSVNGVVRKVVVLSTNANAERYAKGDRSVGVMDIQTKENGRLLDLPTFILL